MIRKIVGLAMVAAALSACVTAVDPLVANAPLKLAFTEPVPSLETRAAAGDRQAQYALSFLKKHGLRGVAEDLIGVETLRATAGAPHTRNMPIYQPGMNGNPGTLINVQITDPGVSDAEAGRMDLCGLTLLTAMPALGGQLCGSPAAYADLAPSAVSARQDLVLNLTAVDPAGVSDCGATGPLWTSAGMRFEAGALDEAGAAADRIIALCGEGERSWHARVMRAILATHVGEADKATTLLAPVPRPAPAPIGAYASFAMMYAQARLEDWPAYAAERDRLISASLQALAAEPSTKALGRFEGAGATVDLFERESLIRPGLTGLIVGVVRSRDPKAAPRAFWLTTSPDMMGGAGPSYFLDEYRCDGRSAFKYFDPGSKQPSVEQITALIGEVLRGELTATSGLSFNRPLSACAFPVQIAPGLGDDQSRPLSVSSTPLP
jgi:hypothetical protein